MRADTALYHSVLGAIAEGRFTPALEEAGRAGDVVLVELERLYRGE